MSNDNIQDLINSSAGRLSVLVVLIAIVFAIVFIGKRTERASTMVFFVAFAIVLSQIPIYSMPQGGSVSLMGMLSIVLCTYYFGMAKGIMTGVCVGIVDLIFCPEIVNMAQVLVDYPIAYGMIGMCGIVFKVKEDAIIPAYITGAALRYICVVISGVVFFGEFAPEGYADIIWSMRYNAIYIGIEVIITILVLSIPRVRELITGLEIEMKAAP